MSILSIFKIIIFQKINVNTRIIFYKREYGFAEYSIFKKKKNICVILSIGKYLNSFLLSIQKIIRIILKEYLNGETTAQKQNSC